MNGLSSVTWLPQGPYLTAAQLIRNKTAENETKRKKKRRCCGRNRRHGVQNDAHRRGAERRTQAGCRTRLESRIKKFQPHFNYDSGRTDGLLTLMLLGVSASEVMFEDSFVTQYLRTSTHNRCTTHAHAHVRARTKASTRVDCLSVRLRAA